jgi:hypothetical protein
MTNQHPITPPPELVEQWADMLSHRSDHDVFAQAARWGADQELEACCVLMDDWGLDGKDLIECRRPQPPSLKEQALALLQPGESRLFNSEMQNTIRRALEALPDD